MSKSETAIEKMNYEQAYSELEWIVTQMETSQQPLEESLRLFERGQQLVRRCAELLEKAELRIQQLAFPIEEPMDKEDEDIA